MLETENRRRKLTRISNCSVDEEALGEEELHQP